MKRICFIHMPKCAGSSVTEALLGAYPRDRTFELDGVAARTTPYPLIDVRRALLAYNLARPLQLIVGRHLYMTPELLDMWEGSSWHFVTVLRDPITRFVSNFYYGKRTGFPVINTDLDTFIAESPEARGMGRAYRNILGASGPDHAIDMLRRFAIVGCFEDLDTFWSQLEDLAGRPLVRPHANAAPLRPTYLTLSQLARVDDLCAVDLAIYRGVFDVEKKDAASFQGGALEDGRQIVPRPDKGVRS